MADEKFTIGEFTFESFYEYRQAQEDVHKIECINSELDVQNPEVAIRLYNDIRDGIITFNSPIGQQFADHVGDIVANKSVDLLDDRAMIQEAEGQAKYNKVVGLFLIVTAVLVFGFYGYNELSDIISARKLANLSNIASTTDESKNNNSTNISNNSNSAISNNDNGADTQDVGLESSHTTKWNTGMTPSSMVMLQDMANLHDENSDVVGWLTVEGTKVDYPVMQTVEDPSYYLRRDFYGKDSTGGTLFMDYRCDYLNSTTNTIIYGHNMKNLTMFGTLKYYLEEDFFNEHKKITLKTLYEEREYEIVTVGLSKVVDEDDDTTYKYYDFINADTSEEFQEFYNAVHLMTVYDSAVDIDETDQLLTLSTCNSYTEDGRLFVVAKRIK